MLSDEFRVIYTITAFLNAAADICRIKLFYSITGIRLMQETKGELIVGTFICSIRLDLMLAGLEHAAYFILLGQVWS